MIKGSISEKVKKRDAATVKRFYREKDRIRLQPKNDRLQPIYTHDCTVLGKVIGLV